jgi:hypothetical protein
MSGEGSTGIKNIEDIFGADIRANFGKYVSQKTYDAHKQVRIYSIINNVIYLLEYERLRKDALNKNEPEIMELDDAAIIPKMNYSIYKPETRFDELGIEKSRIRGIWSTRFADTESEFFPLYTWELEKINTVGQLITKLNKKIRL